MIAKQLALTLLRRIRHGRLELDDGDGGHLCGPSRADLRARITIRSPSFWRSLLGGSLRLAESYGAGDWDCDDLVSMARIGAREMPRLDRLRRPFAPLVSVVSRLPRNTHARARRNVADHYDLGNRLFELFLDETMTYSCAYFPRGDATLHEAQEAKLDRVCSKLELDPDDHLLEIGTGWGSLAIHAAANYGCRVTTITISREQHALASRRIAEAGLEERVTVLLQDYRDVRGRYDKLASVEMIEGVGRQYFDLFFRRCSELLEPGGLMLLQAIVIDDRAYEVEKATRSFIMSLVFPGGCLPSRAVIDRAVRRSTDLRSIGVEDLTPHYPVTLRTWRERFLTNADAVARCGYDDRFRRIWEMYLAWCEAGFLERRIGVEQILLAKPA